MNSVQELHLWLSALLFLVLQQDVWTSLPLQNSENTDCTDSSAEILK